MKYSKIIQLCKQNKTALIMCGGGVQWLSDGQAAYPLYGAPKFDTDSLLTLFDVSEKAAEKMTLKEIPLVSDINFEDYDETETGTSRGRLSIGYQGRVFLPINTEDGIKFIDQRHTTPLAEDNDVEYYMRRQAYTGKPYFVAKTGFCIRAVIPAADIIDGHFVGILKKIYDDCVVSYQNTERDPEFIQTTIESGGDADNADK